MRCRTAPLQPGLFQRAFGQDLRHGLALHLHFHAAGNFDKQVLLVQIGHTAQQATGGDHFIPFGQRLHHGTVLFLAFHLRPDHDEVQGHKHQRQRQELAQLAHDVATGSGGSLGKSRRNKHKRLHKKRGGG